MGLFSSEYKYYAYAGTSPLLPPEEREHTVKGLMLQAMISGQSTLAEAIKMGLQIDLYRRAMKMAKYAADPDGYPYGFPSVTNISYYISWADLEPYVEADVGEPIDLNSYYADYTTNYQYFWIEQGIDDNYASWFTGDPPSIPWYYFPDEIEIPVVNPDTGNYYLADNKNYDVEIVGDTATLTWHYVDKDGNPQTWVAPSYNMNYPTEGQWLMVRYRLTADTTNFDYWFYEIESGLNPALEAAINKLEFEAEYLPIAVMMHDTVWFDEQEPQNVALEEGLDRLLKYIALDPWEVKEEFINAIENPPEDTPPDQVPAMEDIWDFFVHFSMPLRTIDRAARDYLWNFYHHLKTRTWTTFEDYQAWLAGGALGAQPYSQMTVEEGEEYTGYIARYAWSYINDRTEFGRFTPPGWDRPLKNNECWSQEFQRSDSDYAAMLELVHNGTFGPPGVPGLDYLLGPSSERDGVESAYTIVVRQQQLADGDGEPSWNAILVMGPSMEYQINTSRISLGEGAGGYKDFRYRFVDVELFPEDPEEDSEFRWPINIGTLKEVSAMRREPALQEAIGGTVFLVDRVKVKWYQKTFFKWLIIIIVIIVIIIFQQYELLGTVASMASTAAAAGATLTAIALVALYVTLVFALGFLISFAGALIGGTWGKVFVLLATLYLAGGVNIFSNMAQSWGSMTANFGWATASSFLQSIGPVLQIGQMIIEDRALAKLESEMRDFTLTAREKYEQLQDAWDEFGSKPGWLDPLDLVGAFQAQWYVEMPDTYFQRTLNANPGILGYDMINQFTDLALYLPTDGNPTEFINGVFTSMERQRGAV